VIEPIRLTFDVECPVHHAFEVWTGRIARRVRVRSRGRLERPNNGMVADTGRFVLVDWLFTVALDDPRPSV